MGGTRATERADYEPAYQGMVYAPQPNPYRCELGGQTASECAVRCAQAMEELIAFHGPKTIAAVIAEPISSNSGSAVPGDEYWPMLREICDRNGVLLIADEVICGFGRTGKMFAMEHWGVTPDIMTMAKGIVSSYLPFSAAIATREVADVFAGEDNVFSMTLSYGGHPVSAAASLKNIEIIERERLVQNSAQVGKYLLSQLQALKGEHPIIGDVRGRGLMNTIEMVSDHETKVAFPKELRVGDKLNEKFLERGLILRCFGQLINIAPPLCISRGEVDEIVAAVDGALGETERELSIA